MPYRQVGLICPSESVKFFVDYLKNLRFDVRALWTPDQEITIQAAAEYEIPFSASRPDEVLLRKEVQMIIITGRPQIHSQIAIKALGIGKHVLCDTPVTLSSFDSSKMVQAAQYYPQLLALVGFGLRHLDVFRTARQLIAGGYVGSLIACECSVRTGPLSFPDRYNWLWEYSMGGGILNLIGSHVIDIISYVTQRRATRVQGIVKCSEMAAACGSGYSTDEFPWSNGKKTANGPEKFLPKSNSGAGFRRMNADDFASFILKFDNDFVATITLNALTRPSSSVDVSLDGPNENALSHLPSVTGSQGYFCQRILISGTEGQLELRDHDIYGNRFGATFSTGAVAPLIKSGGTDALCNESDHRVGSDRVAEASIANSTNEHGEYSTYTVVPGFYVQGFLNLLCLLADLLPAYELQQSNKQTKERMDTWQTGCLASLASFEDAQYVRAVIDAVRHSSEKGDWVKVDLRSS